MGGEYVTGLTPTVAGAIVGGEYVTGLNPTVAGTLVGGEWVTGLTPTIAGDTRETVLGEVDNNGLVPKFPDPALG